MALQPAIHEKDTGWITLNRTYPTWYRKKNGYVTGGSTPPAGQDVTLGILPVGYGPYQDMGSHTMKLDGRLRILGEHHSSNPRQVDLTPSDISGKQYGAYMNCTLVYPVDDTV